MTDRQREIDEYREAQAQAFYAEAFPCENCGRPAGDRFLDFRSQLWIGLECPCIVEDKAPVELRCPVEYRIVMQAKTVGEMRDAVKRHRETCSVCSSNRKGLRKAA